MKILLFDIQITGHHSEYIGHLVNYLEANPGNSRYCFVVHPLFGRSFPLIAHKARSISNIEWIEVAEKEVIACSTKNLFLKSFAYYKCMDSYAKKYNAVHIVLLYFNVFQFALALFRPKYTVSGILFLQFYQQNRSRMADKLKYYRKYWQTKLICQNKSIETIFILNDDNSVNYMNKEFRTDVFCSLPDPISPIKPLENFNLRETYAIGKQKQIFLHIGSLSGRKGTLEILDSINYIDRKKQSSICLIFAGVAEGSFRDELVEKIKFYKEKSAVQISWIEEFVSNEKMKSLFDQSNCVLIPYKTTEASSGILGHAIASETPVIAVGRGLLKDLIAANGFGILIDKPTPSCIAQGIEASSSFQFNEQAAAAFIKSHTPEAFADKVLKTELLR